MANSGSDEITKIRGEGTFRPEGQKKWIERLWEELKSPQLWWYTVAVALVALSASQITKHQVEKKFYAEEIHVLEKLKIEIDFRAGWGKNYLDYLVQRNRSGKASVSDLETYKLIQQMVDQMVYISRHKISSSRYAYASMYLLLTHLENLELEPDGNIRKAIDDTIASTMRLESMYDDIRTYNPLTTVDEFIERATKQLENLTAVTGTIYLTNGENSD